MDTNKSYYIKNPEDVARMMEAMSTNMAKAGGEFIKSLSPEQQRLAHALLGDGVTGVTAEQLIVREEDNKAVKAKKPKVVKNSDVRGMMRDLPGCFVE